MATAVALSLAGNHAAVIRLLPGNDGASASPIKNRKVKSITSAQAPIKKCTVPCNKVKIDQNKILKK